MLEKYVFSCHILQKLLFFLRQENNMKEISIAFYDTKPYDKDSFIQMNKNFGFHIDFFDFHLNEKTAFSSKGYNVVCAFVNDVIDENVIKIATQILYVCSMIIIVTAFQNCYSGALKGAGDTKFPLYSAIFCTLFVRVVLTYVVVNVLHFGIFYVWLATLTDLVLRAVIIYIRYRSGRWEKYSKKAMEQ